MEISGISTSSAWSYTDRTATSASSSLTEEQKTTLSSILESYDLEDIDGDDLDSLMEELKDSGIEMNEETEEYLAEAGLEKPDDMPPPPDDMPPPPDDMPPTDDATSTATTASSTEEEEIDEDLLDLIEQYQSGSLTEEEFLQQASAYGATGSAGSIVNQYA